MAIRRIMFWAVLGFVAGLGGRSLGGPGLQFEITRFTIDGGGVMFSAGGDFELSGTIGQPDAGVLVGGDFELSGGFWFSIPAGDCEDDGDVDLFDYGAFEACLTGPDVGPPGLDCRCFDVDRSGDIDLLDFAVIQANFTD